MEVNEVNKRIIVSIKKERNNEDKSKSQQNRKIIKNRDRKEKNRDEK